MRIIVILTIAILAQSMCAFAQTNPAVSQKEYSERLKGTWSVYAWTERNKEGGAKSELTLIFGDNNMVTFIFEFDKSNPVSGTFSYNAQQSLHWLDVLLKSDPEKSVRWPGIITWLDDNAARILFDLSGEVRPTKFEEDPGLDRSYYMKKQIGVTSNYHKSSILNGKWDILRLSEADNYSQENKYQTITFLEGNRFKFEGTAFIPGTSGGGRYELNTNLVPHWIDFYYDGGTKNMGLIKEHLWGYKLELFDPALYDNHPVQFSDIEFGNPDMINYNPNFYYLHQSYDEPENPEAPEKSGKTEEIISAPVSDPVTTTRPVAVTSEPGDALMDNDGNSYKTIVFGNGQQWMAENLKTTSYNNGDLIINTIKKKEWYQQTNGAWCYYDNSSSYNASYGKLYNFYAVGDSRQLCPTGWHVPSLTDWNKLSFYLNPETDTINYIDYNNNGLGGLLKSTEPNLWNTPNKGATNKYGFSALAGGIRNGVPEFSSINPQLFGVFEQMGQTGNWWTSSIYNKYNRESESFTILNSNPSIYSHSRHMTSGLSVRCIKD